MNKPHKHAEVIKAWADGAEIEWRADEHGNWRIDRSKTPAFGHEYYEFRVKPAPVTRPTWQYALIDAAKKGKTIEWKIGGIKWVNSTINGTRDPDGFTFEDNPDRYRIKPEKVIRWQWIIRDIETGIYEVDDRLLTEDEAVDVFAEYFSNYEIIGPDHKSQMEFTE